FMLVRAFATSPPEARAAHPLLDDWLLRLPLLGGAVAALGAVSASPAALRRILRSGDVAITFPEGPDAVAKTVAHRYRLASITRGGLLRVAVESGVPIVPVAVIGAEETQPVVWRVERLGRLLGLPAVPVTPVLVPLPTKWTIHVGEPLDPPVRASDPRTPRGLRARVREPVQGLVSHRLPRP